MTRILAVPQATDLLWLGRFAEEAEDAGADGLHIDLVDGSFGPRILGGVESLALLSGTTGLPIEVHLLVLEPVRYLEDVAEAGAGRVVIHAESTHRLHAAIRAARRLNLRVGVALNPATSIVAIEEVLPHVDGILLMTVDPGDTGARCLSTTGRRIFRVRRLADKWRPGIELTIDGDVPPELATSFVEMGATSLVTSSTSAPQPAASSVPALRAALGAEASEEKAQPAS